MRNTLYWIGLALVVLAFIACTISYYLLAFGLPVFGIGAVLVLFSNRSILVKALTTLLPLLLWFPVSGAFLWFYVLYNRGTPETYLLPPGYEGEFVVVFGEPCGVEPELEKDRRLLRIPADGRLIVKPEFEGGAIDHEYYFIDSVGNRKPINAIVEFKERTTAMPCVLLGGSGSVGETPRPIFYTYLYLFNKDSTMHALDDGSVQDAVHACRGGE